MKAGTVTVVTPRIDAMRQIVAEHQARELEGVLVDAFSASAYVQVYDALNPVNQGKIDALDVVTAMDVVWRAVARVRAS